MRKLLDDGQITPEVYHRAREIVLEAAAAEPEPEPEVEPLLPEGESPLELEYGTDDSTGGAEGLLALQALSEQAAAAAAATDGASSAASDLAFRTPLSFPNTPQRGVVNDDSLQVEVDQTMRTRVAALEAVSSSEWQAMLVSYKQYAFRRLIGLL